MKYPIQATFWVEKDDKIKFQNLVKIVNARFMSNLIQSYRFKQLVEIGFEDNNQCNKLYALNHIINQPYF